MERPVIESETMTPGSEQGRMRAEPMKPWLKSLPAIVFIIIFIITVWRIGICPDVLDDYVEFEIHPQVNKVFDQLVVPGEITWDWVDMYQGQAGRSPLYGGLIELGLRMFGLTLFGIRIFPALFGFLVLLFTYYTMTKFYPQPLSLLFVFLLGTAPWYLSMIRSGGIAGFSLSLALLAVSAVALFLKNDWKGILAPIAAGVSVALLPYGYMILRPLYLLLILTVILFIGRVKIRKVVLFLICILAVGSIQFNNLSAATQSFFNSRGESIHMVVGPDSYEKADFKTISGKITDNTKKHLNILLGLNGLENFWNPNIAFAYWHSNLVLYPRFLVPFFGLGFWICLVGALRKRSLNYLAPLIFFGLGLIPGTMSFYGEPNMSRSSLLVIPLYFFIAFSLYRISNYLYQKLVPKEGAGEKILFVSVMALILAGTIGFQVRNFFGYGDERGERGHPAFAVFPFITEYLQKNPGAKIIYHERPTFDEYGAYVHFRLLGGEQVAKKVASGNLIFVRNENIAEVNDLIYREAIDLVVAVGMDKLVENLPILRHYDPVPHDEFWVFKIGD